MLRHIEQTDVEKQRNTIENDPAMLADRKVQAAQKRLDTLVAAQAAGPVIARAQRALTDARLDVMERAAEKNASTRAKALAAAKDRTRLQHENEVKWRIGPSTPVIAMKLGHIEVFARPEKATDPTVRTTCYGDVHKVMQLFANQATVAVGVARNHGEPVIDDQRLAAEARDLARRSIHYGCMTVEIVER